MVAAVLETPSGDSCQQQQEAEVAVVPEKPSGDCCPLQEVVAEVVALLERLLGGSSQGVVVEKLATSLASLEVW